MNKFSLVFLFCFAFIASSWTQSIFTNAISGTNPNTSNPFTNGQVIDANITVSGIGRGGGINGNNANNRYNARDWSTGGIDLSDYFTFILTPKTGYEIDFTNLDYTGQASGDGPTAFAFRSSLDSYGADIANPGAGGATILLSGAAYQNITSAIEFRLYGYSAIGANGTFSVNDFTFNGTVSCATPTTQASGITFETGSFANSKKVSWTRGNGTEVIVVAKNGALSLDPVNGTMYTANAAFGSGSDLGSGHFVVYKGTGSEVTVTGLTNGQTYHFAVYEVFTAACGPTYKTPGATDSSLPIELSSFKAEVRKEESVLSFSTATEINNDYFSIERSANGRDYKEIGQVKGAGTSYEPQEYTYTDARPLQGKNYYRLRQVDFDGQFDYSPVVTATFGKASQMTLAPLPASESLNIQLEKAAKEDGIWQVYDMNGRQVLSGAFEGETKEQQIRISDLPEGAYVLRLMVGQEVMVEQFRKH